MAKVRTLQSALNGGELSPKLRGRADIPRYQSGLELGRNAISMIIGGATRRPGTRYVATAKGGYVRLIDFCPTVNGVLTGYVLELTDQAMRFYSAFARLENGGTPVEIATPFTAAQLPAVNYDQYDNRLYLVHPSHRPKRLSRASDTSWALEDVPISAWPYMRPPGTDGITITPSATSGNITLTASAALFVAGHVGARFAVNGGICRVTAVTDGTHASATVEAAILPGSDVRLLQDTLTILIDPAGIGATPFEFDVKAVADYVADTLTTEAVTPLPPGVSIPNKAGGNPARVTSALTGTEPDKEWKEQAWSDARGWPSAICFFEQRMILANNSTWPTAVWGSKTGTIDDFTIGTLDDDAFVHIPFSATTPINHLVATDLITMLTEDKELTLRGDKDGALTPTSFEIKGRTFHGSAARVRPVFLESQVYFASVTGKKLRGFRYRFDQDGYVAPDLAILADHFLEDGGGIVAMTYTREPYAAVWAVTAAGNLLTLSIDNDQEVSAWNKHHTAEILPEHAGLGDETTYYRSIVKIPDGQGNDQVCIAVQRLVGGEYRTYVEYFSPGLNTDSTLTATDGTGKTVWAGLDHLEGKTVDVVADGLYVQPVVTVQNGQIALPYPARSVEIGLKYITRIKDLPVALASQGSTILGEQVSVNKINVYLYKTRGCTINGERITFRSFGDDLLDKPVPEFTGIKEAGALGWSSDGTASQVEIVQDQPLPLTVLAIIKEVSING